MRSSGPTLCRELHVPFITHESLREICASGGISAQNIHELAGSGIAGVAVISAIFAARNIEAASRELRALSEGIKYAAEFSRGSF